MSLMISKKVSCNTIGFSTNKGAKPETISIPANRIAIKYPDIGIVILRPAIDRLSFGFAPDQKLLDKYKSPYDLDEYKAYIYKSLAGDGFHTGSTGLSYIAEGNFKKPPLSLYNVNLSFKPCPNSEPVLIQVGPKKGGYDFMRFDMNPNRITPKGMKNFWELMETATVMPGFTVSHEDFLIWSRIHKGEICVDILGLRPAEAEITPRKYGGPHKAKSHIYKSATSGRIETIYPKAAMFKSSTERLYDKRQERIDQGHQPLYGDILHTRYESVFSKTTFFQLAGIKNRCNRVAIRALDYTKLPKMNFVHHLFIRHALARTLDKALEIIPDDLKAEYIACYADTMVKIWDSKAIWSFWPDTLKSSGLFPAKK
ncbi:MAG: hypothetical protein H6862_01615 [Rhodospirillales bacterium]|nr:hypothetical protein [Rhodospirillales bacterium]